MSYICIEYIALIYGRFVHSLNDFQAAAKLPGYFEETQSNCQYFNHMVFALNLSFSSFMALTAVFDVCTSEEPNHNVWNIVIETEQIEDAAGRE